MSDTIDDIQLQQQIEQYHHIAQALHSSTEPTEIETVLEPINSLAEATQVAFLKVLGKEKNTDAADIALALNTTSSVKEVRKEARRTLIRLESAHTYPEWSPVAKPTLSKVFEMNSELTETNSNPAAISELQSMMANITAMFSAPAYMDTVPAFIEAWGEERYEEAYDYLSTSSPLRTGLTREDWAEQRRQWGKQAHPTGQQISFINEISDQEQPDQPPRVEIGWSLTFAESPLAQSLKELPLATATFQETGRHWFWSSYTLVEEGDDWLVDTMIDEGANAMQLPVTELQTRLNDIVELAAQRLAEEEALLDEDDEDEDDEDDDEDDLDEDDEDEDDDEAFEDTLQRMDEAIRITTHGMHYNDALIPQIGKSDSSVYEQAYAQAMAVNEPERAVVYLQQLAETFPEKRALALQELALTLNSIIDSYIEEGNEEQVQRFRVFEENVLREAIATDNAPSAYIMLADLLIDEEDRLDEAETLLNKAQTLPLNPQEVPLIEAGLAEIAQIRDEPETALQHYQKVADLAPDYPDIWFNLGSLHHQLHHYDEAILHLHRSVETAPSQTGAFAELAAIYIEQQQLGSAREILKQGLSTNPESADLLAVLSLTYIQSSDLQNAEKYLLQAEELDEDDELVHAIRAVYNEQKAQQRQAPKSKFKQQKQRKKKR